MTGIVFVPNQFNDKLLYAMVLMATTCVVPSAVDRHYGASQPVKTSTWGVLNTRIKPQLCQQEKAVTEQQLCRIHDERILQAFVQVHETWSPHAVQPVCSEYCC